MKTTSAHKDAISFAHTVYKLTVESEQAEICEIFNSSIEIKNLQLAINYQFDDIELLVRALSHTSFVHEFKRRSLKSYERLEFLGDSVLGSFITMQIFNRFEGFNEGKLSKLRSALVNENSLASLARFLRLDELTLLGKGELQEDISDSILCDVFESLIGAICTDSCIEKAFTCLNDIITSFEKENGVFVCEEKLKFFDPKSSLQELTMKEFKVLPEYQSMELDNGYSVSLLINGKVVGEVCSLSKKEAQKKLAYEYLIKREKQLQGESC